MLKEIKNHTTPPLSQPSTPAIPTSHQHREKEAGRDKVNLEVGWGVTTLLSQYTFSKPGWGELLAL